MSATTTTRDRQLCQSLLPSVSRSFALGISLLPRDLSYTVAISYLVCRVADTIEDDVALSVDARRASLATLKKQLEREGGDAPDFGTVGRTDAELRLMNSASVVLREFWNLPTADRVAITSWIVEMINGMSESLPEDATSREPWFNDIMELRRYCYYVAGTVGHLLTSLFVQHSRGIDAERNARLRSLATNFGLALQLTNVIRDVSDDRLEGRNLVPRTVWADAGITPEQLFQPGHEAASRKVIFALLDEAVVCLHDAFLYSTALPRSSVRVRLFCFSHLFFACRTLTLVRTRFLDMAAGRRLKMSRPAVYFITFTTFLFARSNGILGGMYSILSRPLRTA